MESKKRPFQHDTGLNANISCASCNIDDGDILILSTCGCLFCPTCIRDLHESCTKCDNPVISDSFLKLEKGKFCKYYERGCQSGAKFICRCIKDGFLCGSCLIDVHVRMIEQPCIPVPINLSLQKSVNCDDCKILVAEFIVKDIKKNVCMDCKSNYMELETLVHEHGNISKNMDKDFALTKRIMNCKSQKISTILYQRQNILQAEEQKVKESIELIKNNFTLYCSQFEKESESLKKQHEHVKKIEGLIGAGGMITKIVEAAQKSLVNIQGGETRLRDFLSSMRNINVLSFPITRAKFSITQHENIYMDLQSTYEHEHEHDHEREPGQSINTSASSSSGIPEYQQPSTSYAFTPRKDVPLTPTPLNTARNLRFDEEDSLIIVPELEPVSQQKQEPALVQLTRVLSPFYICCEIPELVETRFMILKKIKEHELSWKPCDYAYGDFVIVKDSVSATNPLKRGRVKFIDRVKETVRVFLLDFGFDIMVEVRKIGMIHDHELDIPPVTCMLVQLSDIKPVSNFVFTSNVKRCAITFLTNLFKKHGARVRVTRRYAYEDTFFCRIKQKMEGGEADWSQLLIQNKMAISCKENDGCFIPAKNYCFRFHGMNDCSSFINCHRVHECPFCSDKHSLQSCRNYFSVMNN
ncbi:uncharacterized protein LOC128389072 [Panonychus citri]|uniref:uncharacterized protein LOC128389072 n=1 Tax=Panonychus citri TaxID=50023 RepID=UPI0023083613|nr:uncharacterized protein LOC128389072 [Panonychus citri]